MGRPAQLQECMEEEGWGYGWKDGAGVGRGSLRKARGVGAGSPFSRTSYRTGSLK